MEPSTLCRRFSLDQILSSTQNFDESLVVGCGGSGKVYKGQIDGSSDFVAIKRWDPNSNYAAQEFLAEIQFNSHIRHRNIVFLIGYCDERSEVALVYEYISHGTLADHLYKGGDDLSWLQRLNICLGVARGLDYLHDGASTQYGVIHRDVKSTNILLDENSVAKIIDFGISEVIPADQIYLENTVVKGTFGYLDPEYFHTCKLSRKTDVYGFGVVLLEMICGRPAVDQSFDDDEWNLSTWACAQIKKGKLGHIIDYRIRGQISYPCLKDFTQMATLCVDAVANRRPNMAEIVSKLQSILSKQERPNPFWRFFDKAKILFSSKKESKILFSSKKESSLSNSILAPASTCLGRAGKTNLIRLTVYNQIPKLSALSLGEGEPSNQADDSMDTYERLPASAQHLMTQSEGILNPFSYDVLKEASETGMDTYERLPASAQHLITQSEGILNPFSYDVLKEASRNFIPDSILGKDSHGLVYKGWIDDLSLAAASPSNGIAVAIKTLQGLNHSHSLKWLAEINRLGQLSHPNIVKLIGYCLEDNHRLLVYEFMPGGSMEEHLFSRGSHGVPIPWNLRIKIILDAAKGLAYIHKQIPPVALGHFQSSNILLDSNHNAKISNLCLDPLVTEGCATTVMYPESWVYDGPEFFLTGRITRTCQIYGFGMVLLELLTGMQCIDKNRPDNERNLLDFAIPYLTSKRRTLEIIDSRIRGQYSPAVVMRAVKLVMKCLSEQPSDRPAADELVKALEELQDLQKAADSNEGNES